jgi:hypothetical protein
MTNQIVTQEENNSVYAILSAGLSGDFGQCALVSPIIFHAVESDHYNYDDDYDEDDDSDDEKAWQKLPESVLNEFKDYLKESYQDREYDFAKEMHYIFRSYQSLYQYLSNASYYGKSFSFGQVFHDIGSLANYVSANNLYVVETTFDD